MKQLAKVSGVSVRTLHFYDEIGILKPALAGQGYFVDVMEYFGAIYRR